MLVGYGLAAGERDGAQSPAAFFRGERDGMRRVAEDEKKKEKAKV